MQPYLGKNIVGHDPMERPLQIVAMGSLPSLLASLLAVLPGLHARLLSDAWSDVRGSLAFFLALTFLDTPISGQIVLNGVAPHPCPSPPLGERGMIGGLALPRAALTSFALPWAGLWHAFSVLGGGSGRNSLE